MDDYISVFGPTDFVGTGQILCSLLLSFALCSVFATVYRWTFQGFTYSRGYVHTLVLSGLIVSMLIMAIGNNLARGLGILGTLAIVRFRTPIRDPRDMVFLFASLGVGIACGSGVYTVAVVGTLFISAAALLLHWSPYASRRQYEGLLRFMLPSKSPTEREVEAILQESCTTFHLIAMRDAVQGELVEYSYQIRLIDPSYQADLINKLHRLEGIVDANLLMHRATVEL